MILSLEIITNYHEYMIYNDKYNNNYRCNAFLLFALLLHKSSTILGALQMSNINIIIIIFKCIILCTYFK